jgi:hypothetical protein
MSDQQSEFDKNEIDEGEQIIPGIETGGNAQVDAVSGTSAAVEEQLPTDGVGDDDLDLRSPGAGSTEAD